MIKFHIEDPENDLPEELKESIDSFIKEEVDKASNRVIEVSTEDKSVVLGLSIDKTVNSLVIKPEALADGEKLGLLITSLLNKALDIADAEAAEIQDRIVQKLEELMRDYDETFLDDEEEGNSGPIKLN